MLKSTSRFSYLVRASPQPYTRLGVLSLIKIASTTLSGSDQTPYQLQFYVPKANTAEVLAAIHETGAGIYPGGIYGECAFITSGTGTFRPSEGAKPVIGKVGDVEKVEENKVEVMCFGRHIMQDAIKALKEAHPYEQVAYVVIKGEEV